MLLDFPFVSQCIPTPLAWYAHQLPPVIQQLSVALTLWIEIVAAFLIILPGPRFVRLLAAWIQVLCINLQSRFQRIDSDFPASFDRADWQLHVLQSFDNDAVPELVR